MYLKNKNSSDYTSQVRVFFNVIDTKFRYSARISDIWALIMTGFGLQQFDILEPQFYNSGEFESKLINYLISWKNGEDIDFSEICALVLSVGDFSKAEKLMFGNNNLEECLWAIFMVIDGKEKLEEEN